MSGKDSFEDFAMGFPEEEERQPDDRREHRRTPLILKVEYSDKESFLQDYTTNISRGGTMIRTARDVGVGDTIDLALSFPGLLARIALEGTVRWVRKDEDGERAIGVAFAPGKEGAWAQFERLVERISGGDDRVVTPTIVRLLVVEDNLHIARMIRRGLEAHLLRSGDKFAFEVRHAADGLDAWRMLTEGRGAYNLLIADIFLPGMDGETLIRKVRADAAMDQMAIIALSGGDESTRSRALQAGADFFLGKPIRLSALLATMYRLVTVCSGQNKGT